MRDVLAASPWSFLKFMLGTKAADYGAAPFEATLAAALAGTLAEDCGPCTQIGIDMAAARGADPAVIRAILAGDEAAMGETAALGWRFARASLARDMETCDPLRDEIVRRWGQKADWWRSRPEPDVGQDVPDAEIRPRLRQGLLQGGGGRRRRAGRAPAAGGA